MTPSLNKRQVNWQRCFDRIERCKQSGLSQKAFCDEHQIGIASFRRWRAIFVNEGEPGELVAGQHFAYRQRTESGVVVW